VSNGNLFSPYCSYTNTTMPDALNKKTGYAGLHSCSDDGRTLGQHLASRLVELGVEHGALYFHGLVPGRLCRLFFFSFPLATTVSFWH
jgi:hypothetical protein